MHMAAFPQTCVIWGWGLGTEHEADGDLVDESKRGHGDGLREVLGEGEGVCVQESERESRDGQKQYFRESAL